MLALLLWIFHGLLLWWSWGQFRPRIALLHGLALAVLAGGLILLGLPVWALYVAGALIGAVGGWGHALAPGLWVGLAPLWLLPFLLRDPQALEAVAAFALASQVAAGLVSATKRSL
ncbi:MAG TPA: hypothetical protein VNT75_29740 [Symbiobacteriaceae bacterium]|nr:hypothetical protein [Symbiobacteriaceae bacterium]